MRNPMVMNRRRPVPGSALMSVSFLWPAQAARPTGAPSRDDRLMTSLASRFTPTEMTARIRPSSARVDTAKPVPSVDAESSWVTMAAARVPNVP